MRLMKMTEGVPAASIELPVELVIRASA